MVSTGILRHDKRGGLSNPVNCSTLNNKRQQFCCYGCLIVARKGADWQCCDLRVTRSSSEYRDRGLSVISAVNMHRPFALEPIMQKRATLTRSVFVRAADEEF